MPQAARRFLPHTARRKPHAVFLPHAARRTPFLINFESMRELLTLLSQYPFREENRDRLSELTGQVKDWNKLVDLINSHGIIALAAYNIKASQLEKNIPADAMAVLENGYRKNIVRNTWLAARWKEVNEILCSAGIKHVLLKGMALEHTLYGSNGLRQMNDNDILIKKDEAVRAWNILKDKGYLPELPKSPVHTRIMLNLGKHLPCLYKNGYAIEIHHSLSGNDEAVEKAVEININETKAFILSREKQLKHLTDHYNRHALEGDCQLRLYTDIKLLDEFNKAEKNSEGTDCNLEEGARIANPRQLFEPDEVKSASACNVEISDSFIEDPIQCREREFHKVAYRLNLKSIAPEYRLRFLLGDIFPSIAWMKKRYRCGGIKAMLYYPHRIGKILWIM